MVYSLCGCVVVQGVGGVLHVRLGHRDVTVVKINTVRGSGAGHCVCVCFEKFEVLNEHTAVYYNHATQGHFSTGQHISKWHHFQKLVGMTDTPISGSHWRYHHAPVEQPRQNFSYNTKQDETCTEQDQMCACLCNTYPMQTLSKWSCCFMGKFFAEKFLLCFIAACVNMNFFGVLQPQNATVKV